MSTEPFADRGRERRARAVSEAVYSSAMAGLAVTPLFDVDAVEYVEGAIDLVEFGRRVRARNGVHHNEPGARS